MFEMFFMTREWGNSADKDEVLVPHFLCFTVVEIVRTESCVPETSLPPRPA